MSSYFDIASGIPGHQGQQGQQGQQKQPEKQEYRYYKCIKHTCNKVNTIDNDTINIPTYIPVPFDKLLIKYHLKTFLPISIS
jgi:hypothetical protein